MARHPKDYRQAVLLYAEGMSLKALAARYGITPQSMWAILKFRGAARRQEHRDDSLAHLGMSPEQTLIAALLRVAVNDARSRAHSASSDGARIAEARAWLRNREAVMYWLDLADLPETTYERLLAMAGLEEA
jgi:hypothetical protein